MRAGFHVGERGVEVVEGEVTIDDGRDVVLGEKSIHFDEGVARIDHDARDADAFHEDLGEIDLSAETGEGAEQRDGSVGGGGPDGLVEGGGAAVLDGEVDAAAFGELEDLLFPVGVCAVVDGFVGSEAAGAGELVIAGAGDDDAGAAGLGDLYGEDGYAACSEREHGLAGADIADGDERAPGGERGDGECCRLGEVESGGQRDEGVGGQDDFLGGEPRGGQAECALDIAAFEASGLPSGNEMRYDVIADLPFGDVVADGGDYAGAVAEWGGGELEAGVVESTDDEQVAEIEAGGFDGKAHFAGAGCWLGSLDEAEIPESPIGEFVGTH